MKEMKKRKSTKKKVWRKNPVALSKPFREKKTFRLNERRLYSHGMPQSERSLASILISSIGFSRSQADVVHNIDDVSARVCVLAWFALILNSCTLCVVCRYPVCCALCVYRTYISCIVGLLSTKLQTNVRTNWFLAFKIQFIRRYEL